ncbi:hypothetical protein AM501_19410 [Aneurinibacillus migulanus]|nr:hypothetical protein TS64_15170 [Aneurinibacillus migulanus]KPD06789.1 hypothetical protein AM501_19410 [Aneurinibacillus migulanus]
MRPAIRQKKGQRVIFRPLPPTALPSSLTSHHKNLLMYQIRCIYINIVGNKGLAHFDLIVKSQRRTEKFIEKVIQNKTVWGLHSTEG